MQDQDTETERQPEPQLKVVRAALHEQAAERLRTLIVRGKLEPGTRIVEGDLCELLDVSRTPLREALKLLAAEGLVELRPNRGAWIAPMRRKDIAELFEAVGGLERMAAERAAERLTDAELRRLHKLQDSMEQFHEAGRLDSYFRLNQQIHCAIVAGAKNEVLKATHETLLARVERARFFALGVRGRWDESVLEHREILDALDARDGATAGRVLEQHVLRTGEVVNETLKDSDVVAAE